MSASTEMEAAAQAATPEAGILDQTIDSFIETMDGFLSELRVVWPGCMALKRLRLEFDVAITHAFSEEARSMAKRKVVSEWNSELSPFYERCAKRDVTIFSECDAEIVRSISIEEKFGGADEGTQESIFLWLIKLNEAAQLFSLYSSVPERMMTTVQSAAMQLAQQIESGERSQEDIFNVESLAAIGNTVAASVNSEDIESLTSNICADRNMLGGLNSLFTMMGGQGGQGGATGVPPYDGHGESGRRSRCLVPAGPSFPASRELGE